jgi:CO/xanthine dehydrogenase Mo-binding subunit
MNPEDVIIENGKAYLKEDPSQSLDFKDIVFCIKEPGGNAMGKPVIGRGRFTMQRLSILDTETGEGKQGPYWTVGAQAVEIEYNKSEHTFRLVNAATVIDAGKVIDPGCAAGQIMGGMNTGLSLATREVYNYDPQSAELKDTSFRTYKIMHFNENPKYYVEFIETPNLSGPYGLRGLAEHAVLGMPPALANALGRAAGIQFDTLPITFESIWNMAENKGSKNAGV